MSRNIIINKEQIHNSLNIISETKNSKIDYNAAVAFAEEKHYGQYRQGQIDGKPIPYSTHPIAVAQLLERKGFNIEYRVTGLFHDLKEDTNATDKEILALSSERVLNAVNLLTKPPKPKDYYQNEQVRKQYMKKYFDGIKSDDIALNVKLADRIHNLKEMLRSTPAFILKQLKETEEYFIDLARGTVFEEDLRLVVNEVKEFYKNNYEK